MRRFVVFWAVCGAAALTAWSLYAAANFAPEHAPFAIETHPVAQVEQLSDADCEALVDQLPEDASGWHTSVFTHVRLTAQERQILDWFNADKSLSRLRHQTHFHHYNQSMGVWSRYANLTTSLPAVVVQDASGKVIYKASGDDIPRAPWPLVRGIVECIRAHCPHCPRPRPRPEPDEPDDEPIDGPLDKPVVPDVVGPNENTPSNAKDDTVAVTVGVFAAATAISFLLAARKSGRQF